MKPGKVFFVSGFTNQYTMSKRKTSSSTPSPKLIFGFALYTFCKRHVRGRREFAQRLSEANNVHIPLNTVNKWFYQETAAVHQLVWCTTLFGTEFFHMAAPEMARALGIGTKDKGENALEKMLEKERLESNDLKAQLKFAKELLREMGGSNGVMKNGDEVGIN